MPKRLVSWGVLLFTFAMILLAYKPAESGWSYSFDWTYHVPIVTMPNLGYWIVGVIAIGLSLVFIVGAFRNDWHEKIGKFVNEKAYYPGFIVFWLVYIIGFIKGVGAVISISPPSWVVYLVFFYGLALFVIIPFMYFKGLSELRKRHAAPPVLGDAKEFDINQELPSIDIVLDEVRRRLDFQFEQLDGLSTKAGIVLGVAGVIFTLLVTSLLSLPSTTPNLYLAKIALIPIIIALVLSFIAIYILKWNRPPNLDRLRDYYIVKDAKVTKLNVIDKCLEGIDKNKKLIDKLFFLVKSSYILLLMGLVLLAVWMGIIIW